MPPKSLHQYAVFVACVSFLLVLAGGMVTSTGSALAVPDWPLSMGQFFPRMEGGVLYEHGHRMIAGTVMLLTLILVVWIQRQDPRLQVRGMALGVVGLMTTQALLGGMTVLYRLPAPISIAHATLGQIFFTFMVCIAVLTGSMATARGTTGKTKLQRLGLLTVGFILFQLVAGATLRHTGKALHLHLLGAVLVSIHVPLLAKRTLREVAGIDSLRYLAMGLPLLVGAQLVLGYISWKSGPVLITTAHVGVGALILAGATVITMQSFRLAEAGA